MEFAAIVFARSAKRRPANGVPPPAQIAGTTRNAGQFSRWGPPTGIARERETRTDNAGHSRSLRPSPYRATSSCRPNGLPPMPPVRPDNPDSRPAGASGGDARQESAPARAAEERPAPPTTTPPANALFRTLLKGAGDAETAYTAAREIQSMAGQNVTTELVARMDVLQGRTDKAITELGARFEAALKAAVTELGTELKAEIREVRTDLRRRSPSERIRSKSRSALSGPSWRCRR